MSSLERSAFGLNFQLGVATSSYQIEGAVSEDVSTGRASHANSASNCSKDSSSTGTLVRFCSRNQAASVSVPSRPGVKCLEA